MVHLKPAFYTNMLEYFHQTHSWHIWKERMFTPSEGVGSPSHGNAVVIWETGKDATRTPP